MGKWLGDARGWSTGSDFRENIFGPLAQSMDKIVPTRRMDRTTAVEEI